MIETIATTIFRLFKSRCQINFSSLPLSGPLKTPATATRVSTARSFHTVRFPSRRRRRNSRNLQGELLHQVVTFAEPCCTVIVKKLDPRLCNWYARSRNLGSTYLTNLLLNSESWRGSGPVFFRDSVISGGYPADFGLPKATSTLPNRSSAHHAAAVAGQGRCFSPLTGLAEEPETDIVSPVHHSSPKTPISFQGRTYVLSL